jgi:hypothetical protein
MNVVMKLVKSFCGPQVPKVLTTFATVKSGTYCFGFELDLAWVG